MTTENKGRIASATLTADLVEHHTKNPSEEIRLICERIEATNAAIDAKLSNRVIRLFLRFVNWLLSFRQDHCKPKFPFLFRFLQNVRIARFCFNVVHVKNGKTFDVHVAECEELLQKFCKANPGFTDLLERRPTQGIAFLEQHYPDWPGFNSTYRLLMVDTKEPRNNRGGGS